MRRLQKASVLCYGHEYFAFSTNGNMLKRGKMQQKGQREIFFARTPKREEKAR
jgi:hypothetical protein